MDYYTAQFTIARDSRKVYWDSQKQAARQVSLFPIHFKYDHLHHAVIFRSSAIRLVF